MADGADVVDPADRRVHDILVRIIETTTDDDNVRAWLCQLEVAPGGRLEVAPCDFKLNRELPPRLAANEG